MTLQDDLARNYLLRLQAFDLETGSVRELESARRFVREYSGKGADSGFKETLDAIHDRLEAIIVESLKDPSLKSSFVDLARRYDSENTLVADRAAPSAPKIAPDRLKLVTNYEYDKSIYHAERSQTTDAVHPGGGLPGGPGDPQGSGPGSPQGGDSEEGLQETGS